MDRQDRETAVPARTARGQPLGVNTPQQPMRGPHLHGLTGGVHQHGHDPVGAKRTRGRGRQVGMAAHLGLVGKGGFVPMVAVGHDQPLARQMRPASDRDQSTASS